jgi:hypothetical protein
MKQRIALVAVTALTAGVLSVATSPVANASAGDIDIVAPGSTVSGVCSVGQSGSFVAKDSLIVGTLAAPTTVTIALGGVLLLDVESTHVGYSSNGVITGSTFDTAPVLNSAYGLYYGIDNDTVTITATAVGTATINSYVSAPFSAANTANTILATPNGTMTVTVVATCAATGYSATYSAYEVKEIATSVPSLTKGDTLTFGAGSAGFISIVAKNGYDEALPATTTFVASATNGALVKVGASGTSAASVNASTYADGTLSSSSEVLAGTNVYVKVVPASKAVGGTTTVTVTAGGVTVLTKTLTFLPEATKLVVVKNLVGSLSAGEGAFLYELQTATGVSVPGSLAVRTTTLDPRITSVTAIKDATVFAAVPASTVNAVATATVLLGSSTATSKYGISKFACNSGSTTGSTKVTLRHTTPVTEANIDTEVTLSCAGGLSTYTISTDKAAYKIGEIATITVTGKDSTGAAVSDFTTVPTADALSVGGGTLIKNTATDNAFSGGIRNYQAQMTTAGTFNVASIISATVTKSATTGYSVSAGTTEVTNAEVLKSIVALIASINKQIAALQKLILARR